MSPSGSSRFGLGGDVGFSPLPNPAISDTLTIGSISAELSSDLSAFAALRMRTSISPSSDASAERVSWTRVREHRGGSGSLSCWTSPLDPNRPLGRQAVSEIVQLVAVANANHFRFACDRLVSDDPPLLLRFTVNDHRKLAPDLDRMHTTRKLTALVSLGQSGTLDGGRVGSAGFGGPPPNVGDIVVLPSFVAWEISKVLAGTVLYLVVRLHGPPFR